MTEEKEWTWKTETRMESDTLGAELNVRMNAGPREMKEWLEFVEQTVESRQVEN
jgi:hypothetical protein